MYSLNLQEKKLLDQLKKGDPKALEKIYHRYAQQLYAYGLQLCKEPHTAQDLLQEIMLKLWTNREKIELHTSLRSYLYKAYFRKFQDHYQQQRRHQSLLEDLRIQAHLELEDTPEPNNSLASQRLQKLIQKLPPKAQQILKLHKWEQLTYTEIANYLKLSPRTVENHLRNAMRLLRKGFLEESKKDR